MSNSRHFRLTTMGVSVIVSSLIILGFSVRPSLDRPHELAAQTAAGPDTAAPLAGDGVTDDTAALLRLITTSRGDVVLRRGRYRITKTIEIKCL